MTKWHSVRKNMSSLCWVFCTMWVTLLSPMNPSIMIFSAADKSSRWKWRCTREQRGISNTGSPFSCVNKVLRVFHKTEKKENTSESSCR